MKLSVILLAAVMAVPAVLLAAQGVTIRTTEVNGRLIDDINLPFVDDPAVIGEWRSVDLVKEPGDFTPGTKRFQGDLYLGGFNFYRNGAMGVVPFSPASAPWFRWTRGVVTHSGDKTASRYFIKEVGGRTYMFFEWKSGDYVFKHRKPEYYVLRKIGRGTGQGTKAPSPERAAAE